MTTIARDLERRLAATEEALTKALRELHASRNEAAGYKLALDTIAETLGMPSADPMAIVEEVDAMLPRLAKRPIMPADRPPTCVLCSEPMVLGEPWSTGPAGRILAADETAHTACVQRARAELVARRDAGLRP